jgi:DNA-directed RNA polymerase subunit M/transcription elongation factor TFIIS
MSYAENQKKMKRNTKKSMFAKRLEFNEPFKALSQDKKDELINSIEKSCYQFSKEDGIFSDKKYDYICFNVISNLDKNSDVNSSYLLSQIIEEKISPIELAGMNSYQLCPAATENIFNELKKKSGVEVSLKTTDLYQCKNCKSNKCLIKRHQNRSSDEGIGTRILCLVCGKVFAG